MVGNRLSFQYQSNYCFKGLQEEDKGSKNRMNKCWL